MEPPEEKSEPVPISKPRSEKYRPEITRLPPLTCYRKVIRRLISWLLRFLIWVSLDVRITGKQNIPKHGACLLVSNHLGDSDALLGWAFTPRIDSEVIIKSELHRFPFLGFLLNQYGVLWVHRGEPDRKLIREVMQGIKEGRLIGIAPEGRESLTGGLEEGTVGAAYLALKAELPIIPLTFTGTENKRIFSNLRKLRRTAVTITIGQAFRLTPYPDRRRALEIGTREIMLTLARQLPPSYRGVYEQDAGWKNGH